MDAISIEVRARCVGCGRAVPINGCIERAACGACRADLVLDGGTWQTLLAGALARSAEPRTFTVTVDDTTFTVARRPETASCPSCKAALPDEVKQFASRGWTMCPSCGKRLALRAAPAHLAWSGATLIAAEELNAPPPPVPTEPVMLGCFGCRAPLRAEGQTRFPNCASCGTTNYLPDEVWAHLHPIAPAMRWFVVGAVGVPSAAQHAAAIIPIATSRADTEPAVVPYAGSPPPLFTQHAPPPFAASVPAFAANAPLFVASTRPPLPPAPVAAPRPAIVAGTLAALAETSVVVDERRARAPANPKPNVVLHGNFTDRWGDADLEKWYSLENVVMGPDGLFYCGGEIDGQDCVWCMGLDLVPRWAHFFDKLSDIKIALDVTHQRIFCWSGSKHSGFLISLSDGSLAGQIGGKEPEDAKVHHLDMEACECIVGDVDGTLLAMMGDRLLRYDGHGSGIATWPPHSGLFGAKAEKLEPIFRCEGTWRNRREVESVDIENVGNHPTILDAGARIHVARDGRLIAMSRTWIAAFDPTGKRLFKRKMPLDSTTNDPSSDALGNVYVRGSVSGDPDLRQVVRVAPDGARADVVATDRSRGGAVGQEDHLCAAPDGTIHLLDFNMRMRTLGPDGQLRWQSAKSIEEDTEEDKRAADRA